MARLPSKRIQVLVEETELKEIQRLARRQRMSVAEWVRQALHAARRELSRTDVERKLQAVRVAAAHSFPTADSVEMLRQIESGFLYKTPR